MKQLVLIGGADNTTSHLDESHSEVKPTNRGRQGGPTGRYTYRCNWIGSSQPCAYPSLQEPQLKILMEFVPMARVNSNTYDEEVWSTSKFELYNAFERMCPSIDQYR